MSNSSLLDLTITLPAGLSARTSVPLAALVLEYPVAYCPPVTVSSPFLSSVTLDVYQVCLKLQMSPDLKGDTSNHSILKFSCPSELGISYPERLSPVIMMEKLQSFFDSRLADWTPQSTAVVTVHHDIETLDRVAL